MTQTENKYIEKLKELITHYRENEFYSFPDSMYRTWIIKRNKLESEISALESEMEKENKMEIENYSFSSDPHDD